jgi:aryl-alcohol dehydrogenase-like predicted oxidoreductase
MKYKQLGKSGLLLSELGLGTMIFGSTGENGTPAPDAERMIHQFLDFGGNHIDTANVYAGGRSEQIVGKAIKDRRSDIVLATKVRVPTGANPNSGGLSRFHIIQAIEASLQRLATDYIDLYYMHVWDPLTPLEESLRAFDDLVTAGKVRYIGVSNFKAWQVMKALAVSEKHNWVGFVAAQYQYSLVKRDIEYEFSDLCQTEGLGLTPWGPLGGGFLSGKYRPDRTPKTASEGRIATSSADLEEAWARRSTEKNWQIMSAVEEVAKQHAATHSQVALAWLKVQPAVSSVILGARTTSQLEENLKATGLELSSAELDHLNEVSKLPELNPYRMLEMYGKRNPNPVVKPK